MIKECVIRGLEYKEEKTDVCIKDGRIRDIFLSNPSKYNNLPSLNLKGIMLPTLIDCHVHLRDPGQEYKEDIVSGLRAAAGGGFSHVFAMANTSPVNDSESVTRYMIEKAKEHYPKGPILHPVAALTKGLKGRELAPLFELKEAGCIATSNDGIPVLDNEIFRRAMEYSHDVGLIVLDHCEDPHLAKDGCMNEGELSDRLGLKGHPTVAEALQVARDILLSSYLDIPIHLCHISCEQSVELIYFAKKKGIEVTAETCPHYLLWDESIVDDYNTNAKVNPPLRTKDDVMAIRDAVREGIIDIIVTDHAPHAQFEKEVPFATAPNGISGLDTALCLLMDLVTQGVFEVQDIIRCMHTRPKEIFSLEVEEIKKDSLASFIVFDTDLTWTVKEDTLLSKGKNTPCLGKELKGKLTHHFFQGNLIYQLEDALY